MSIKIKKNGWIAIIVLIALGLVAFKTGYLDKLSKFVGLSETVEKINLPDAPDASLASDVPMLAIPTSDKPAFNNGTKIEMIGFTWASKFAMTYAVGGKRTVKGSLTDLAGLDVTMTKQEDCNVMCAELVKFARQLKEGKADKGVMITFMGSGVPAFIAGINKELAELGPEYQAFIVPMSTGRSDGEDQIMGPPSILQDPQTMRGKVCAVVPMDGNEDNLLLYLGDNGVAYNSNPKYYDANALNVIFTDDFLKTSQLYNSGYTEKKEIIVDGKTTGRDTIVGIDMISTWSPADIQAAHGRGGLVRIASTHEYPTMMPNITLTIKKWAVDNREAVEKLIVAFAQAGDQVRSYSPARKYAIESFVRVFEEENYEYWEKYSKGAEEKDTQGLKVKLGGSRVFTMTETANLFGLGADGIDRFKIVYETFGDYKMKYHPEEIPSYPSYESVTDKSFLINVLNKYPELLEGRPIKTEYASSMTQEVTNKNVDINFDLGKATIKPQSYKLLDEIFNQVMLAESLKIRLEAHTDASGSDEVNIPLSKARAQSVKDYLVNKGVPANRIETEGYGSTKPIQGTNPYDGVNRRCSIILGN